MKKDVIADRIELLKRCSGSGFVPGMRVIYEAACDIERALIEPAEGAAQWISVDERLPAKDVPVLVTGRGGIEIDEWGEIHEAPVSFSSHTICVGEGWCNNEFEDVTHWMPLPNAPKAEAERKSVVEAA